MVCLRAYALFLQLLIVVESFLFLYFFLIYLFLSVFIYLFMQILLEEWKQIVYKTKRINTIVWNFIYLFIDVLVVPALTVPFYTLFCVSVFAWSLFLYGGSGSSVGIATDYRLDGPGSNPSGDEIFRLSRPALGPTQPPVQWVPGLSRG